LRYALSGRGLLHETGGSLESWDLLAPRLAVDRRVLRYDARDARGNCCPRATMPPCKRRKFGRLLFSTLLPVRVPNASRACLASANQRAMKAFLIALAVAQVGGTCVEFLTRPRAPLLARCTAALLLRAAVFAFVFAFFFAFSWRPAFAAAGTIVFTAVFVAISRARRHQMPA